jgi:hypothetical protein
LGPVFQLPERVPGERRDDQAVADLIGSRIAELLPPAYRGVYGSTGEPDAAAEAELRSEPVSVPGGS